MKKREIKKINLGEDFQLVNNNKCDIFNKRFLSLNQCYNNCSGRKWEIYQYYYDMLCNNCESVLSYGVKSYNCNFIVLNALIEKDNILYYVLITPAHNYIMEIVED